MVTHGGCDQSTLSPPRSLQFLVSFHSHTPSDSTSCRSHPFSYAFSTWDVLAHSEITLPLIIPRLYSAEFSIAPSSRLHMLQHSRPLKLAAYKLFQIGPTSVILKGLPFHRVGHGITLLDTGALTTSHLRSTERGSDGQEVSEDDDDINTRLKV